MLSAFVSVFRSLLRPSSTSERRLRDYDLEIETIPYHSAHPPDHSGSCAITAFVILRRFKDARGRLNVTANVDFNHLGTKYILVGKLLYVLFLFFSSAGMWMGVTDVQVTVLVEKVLRI